MSSTRLIRTLSDQHWHNAGLTLFSQEFLYEYTAGVQGDWVFKVKKIKGHPTTFNAITYYRDVEISRTKLDIWKYISANPNLSWVTYL